MSTRLIVTSKLALLELLWESVAVQPTDVVPTGNVEPDAGEHTGVIGPSMLSLAVAV